MPKLGEVHKPLGLGEHVSCKVSRNSASRRVSDGADYCELRVPSSVASALDVHPGMVAVWSVLPDGSASIRFTF